MATLSQVFKDLRTGIITQLGASGVQFIVGTGWPADPLLQDARRGKNVVAVIHKSTVNKNLFNDTRQSRTDVAVGVSITIDNANLAPLATSTITLSGTPVAGDTIGVIFRSGLSADAAVYIASSADSLATIASGIATAINAKTLNAHAAATGAQIAITSTSNLIPAQLTLKTGNATSIAVIKGVAYRNIQVNVWADSADSRDTIRDTLEQYFPSFKGKWDFALTTCENIAIKYKGSTELDTERQKDLYDWCFLLNVEHFLTTTEQMYEVFLPVAQQAPL